MAERSREAGEIRKPSKNGSKSSSKSISSSLSKRSSKKERAVSEKLKVAELIAVASFIQKRREAELQAETLKEEQELAKAQARMRILDKENKVDHSKSIILSGTERGKKMWLKEELHKNILPDNSKEHHGVQDYYPFQETFVTKKPLSREIILLGVPAMLEIIPL